MEKQYVEWLEKDCPPGLIEKPLIDRLFRHTTRCINPEAHVAPGARETLERDVKERDPRRKKPLQKEEGGGATSSDPGVFTPTFGSYKKREELEKGEPPRPGLVPQSGDYQRPYRWVRPEEASIPTQVHETRYAAGGTEEEYTKTLQQIRKQGLQIRQSVSTNLLSRRLARAPAIFTFSFNQWLSTFSTFAPRFQKLSLAKAVFVLLTPVLQQQTEVQDYELAHGGKEQVQSWKVAKRPFGKDISHIKKPEYATHTEIPPSNLILGEDLLKQLPENFTERDIQEGIQKIALQRRQEGLLKAEIAIHIWSPDEVYPGEESPREVEVSSAQEETLRQLGNPDVRKQEDGTLFIEKGTERYLLTLEGQIQELRKEDTKLSVKVVLTNPEGQVLVLKDHYSDWVDLPGGHVGDQESPNEALEREVREETQLSIQALEPLFTRNVKLGPSVRPVIFYRIDLSSSPTPHISEEHDWYKWTTEKDREALNLGVFKPLIKEILKQKPPPVFNQESEELSRDIQIISQQLQKGYLPSRERKPAGKLKKGMPPRPGLVPKSGDYQHPDAWIIPPDIEHSFSSKVTTLLRDYEAGKMSKLEVLALASTDEEEGRLQNYMQQKMRERFQGWKFNNPDVNHMEVLKSKLPERLFQNFQGFESSETQFENDLLKGANAVYKDGKVYLNPKAQVFLCSLEEYIPGGSPTYIALHEFGHHIEHQILTHKQRDEWDTLYTKYWKQANHWELRNGMYPGLPTYYSLSSLHEYFADIFALSQLDPESKFFTEYPEIKQLLEKQGLW